MIRRTRQPILRRGSVYITVLGVSTLVLVIGVGAVMAGRVQARTAGTANDFAEARICARSGLELGMLAIYNDPYWRTHLGNGTWYTNASIGKGSFTLTAADPIDSDVTNGENDPVVLTCTGQKGAAKYIMSVRMEVGARVGSCLEVSLCAGDNISVQGATLTSDQTVSSNTQFSSGGGGATVNANVEAYKQVGGSGYTKTTKVTGLQRTMPDPLHALDYYNANGTVIPYSSLTQSNSTELITNEKFELGVTGWYAIAGCQLQWVSNVYKEGFHSLRCTSRNSITDAAATDLPVSAIVAGHKYNLKFSVNSQGLANMHVTLTITTSTGTFNFSTPDVAVLQSIWTDLATSGNAPLAPIWTGAITKATVWVYSDATNKDYYLDDLSFKDVTYPGNSYVMEGQLLTPTINSYGASNTKGIYIIDGGNKTVVVANSRIIGTLVMRNCGGNSGLEGSVCMEPAVANFPTFLTDSQVDISLSSAALSEATWGVNFNPPGAPYPYVAGTGTVTNSTATDVYPSAMNGLVYSTQDLTIDTSTSIAGVVITNGKVQVNATSLNLNYSNVYLNNPPPGFSLGTIQMSPVPGTWQRVGN